MENRRTWIVCGLILLMGIFGFGEQERAPKRVLIIGDSVSIGYTGPLTKQLDGYALVEHNPGNALDSRNVLKNLDVWIGDVKWNLIHFNAGLHDIRYVDENWKTIREGIPGPGSHYNVEPEQYRENLIAIVAKLKQTGAKIIFATTTPFPPNPDGPYRNPADVPVYNKIALEVMSSEGIQVDDLYSFVLPQQEKLHKQPANVHFTPEGSAVIAQYIAEQMKDALK